MWKKKIKKQKGQFLLIGIILMVSSFIFAVSIDFAKGVSNYTEEYYNRENLKDVVLQVYSKETGDKVVDFIENDSDNLKDYKRIEALNYNLNVFFKEKNLELSMASLIGYENKDELPWDISVSKGEETDVPKRGTIWVNTLLAELNNIEIGDEIIIKDGEVKRKLEVSALVNDAISPSTTIGLNNFFINKEDMKKFKNGLEVEFITYNTKLTGSEIQEDLKSNGLNEGLFLDRVSVKMAADTTSMITSGVSIGISLIIIIAAAIIIRFIITKNITKEYKNIGVYKTLGLTSNKIKGIYFKSYGLVSILGIAIGAIISNFFSGYLIEMSVKYIGKFDGIESRLDSILIAIVVVSLIAFLNLYITLRKIDKVKPVEAFRVGLTSSKSKFKKSFIKNAVSPVSMGINDIFKYKKQNIMIILVLVVVVYMISFIYTVNYSVSNMGRNADKVFGVLGGDAVIEISSSSKDLSKLKEDLARDGLVDEARENGIDITGMFSTENVALLTIINESYDEESGFRSGVTEGRNPINRDEVAVSIKILKDENLKVGDYITLNVDNEKKEFLITGSYTSMLNMGNHIRVTMDTVPKEKLANRGYVVTLNGDFEEFKEKYEEKYEGVLVNKTFKMLESASESVILIVEPVTLLIIIGSLIFSLLTIINLIVMNNSENRRNFAIMKSLGFSTNYIIIRTISRIIILMTVAGIVGLGLNVGFTDTLMKLGMQGVSIVEIPHLEVLIITKLIAVMISIVTYISMKSIKKISAIELMEE